MVAAGSILHAMVLSASPLDQRKLRPLARTPDDSFSDRAFRPTLATLLDHLRIDKAVLVGQVDGWMGRSSAMRYRTIRDSRRRDGDGPIRRAEFSTPENGPRADARRGGARARPLDCVPQSERCATYAARLFSRASRRWRSSTIRFGFSARRPPEDAIEANWRAALRFFLAKSARKRLTMPISVHRRRG